MSTIRCQGCGTVNPAGSAYCTNCARKLDEATQERVAAVRASHTATGIRWTAVLLTVLIVLVVAAVLAVLVFHVL